MPEDVSQDDEVDPWVVDGPDPHKLAFADRRADPAALVRYASRCLQVVGVGEEDADLTAQILIDADLHGTETHGIALLYTHYVQGVADGEINPTPAMEIRRGSPTTAAVDGDGGLGMLVSHRAMSECIAMAEESGTGWATAYNSTHSAAGGYYVRMAAARNMIGFHWSTGGSTIAVPGGRGRLLGNNPFSFGAPSGSHGPLVLDMAPSTTIRPKIRFRSWQGRELPDMWTVDDDGEPITDTGDFFARVGSIVPLGSTPDGGAYKGFGLLLMSDVLTGALSGDGGSLLRRKGEHSHAFCALRIDSFPTGDEFLGTMDTMIDTLHGAPKASDGQPIRFPGERSNGVFEERSRLGIPLQNYVIEELQEMSAELGVSLDDVWVRS